MAPPPTLKTIEIAQLSDSVVLFSYNQPHIANAFTITQYLDLREALVWAGDEPTIKVVVQCVYTIYFLVSIFGTSIVDRL
jgi:hypothetical protein